MLFFTSPYVQPMPVQTAYVRTAHGSIKLPTYGVCEFASNRTNGGNEFNPSEVLLELLPKNFRNKVKNNSLSQKDWDVLTDWEKHVSLQVVTPPLHGKVSQPGLLSYFANDDYIGKDRTEVLVSGQDLNGHEISIKLIYFINVASGNTFHNVTNNYYLSLSKYCHSKNKYWRISQTPNANR